MKKLSTSKKIINLCFALLFLWMAVIQFNDPDPMFWVGIYGFVMILSAYAIFARFNIILILLGLFISLAGSLYLMPSVFEWALHHGLSDIITRMSPDRPYIEEARESIGLLISSSALVYLYAQARAVKMTIYGKKIRECYEETDIEFF